MGMLNFFKLHHHIWMSWPNSVPTAHSCWGITQIRYSAQRRDNIIEVFSKNILIHNSLWEQHCTAPLSTSYLLFQILWRRECLCDIYDYRHKVEDTLKKYLKYYDSITDMIWDECHPYNGNYPPTWHPGTILTWAAKELRVGYHSMPQLLQWEADNATSLLACSPQELLSLERRIKELIPGSFPGNQDLACLEIDWSSLSVHDKKIMMMHVEEWIYGKGIIFSWYNDFFFLLIFFL